MEDFGEECLRAIKFILNREKWCRATKVSQNVASALFVPFHIIMGMFGRFRDRDFNEGRMKMCYV